MASGGAGSSKRVISWDTGAGVLCRAGAGRSWVAGALRASVRSVDFLLSALREATGGSSAKKQLSMIFVKGEKPSVFFLDFYNILPFLLPIMPLK